MKSLIGKKNLKSRFHEMDFALVLVTLILSLTGIVMAYSASYYYSISKYNTPNKLVAENIRWFIIGWAALIMVSKIDYHSFRRFAIPSIAVGLLLLIILILFRGASFTRTINNATRWLYFGVSIMPGELIKPALILFFSAVFSANEGCMSGPTKNPKIIAMCFGLLALIGFLIYKQPNLSTAVIVVGLGIILMFVAGLHYLWLGIGAGGIALLGLYLYYIDDGYMHTRLVTAIDPWADPLGDGYQIIQSLLAFGSGGVLGKGLGQSIQKTLYLPEPQNDFILPIIGEEIGFVGVVAILILYAILIGRIISVALRAKDSFGAYLAAGTAVLFAVHIILNILVVTATFPPTGVFLPLMSQGGNATLIFLTLIGIVLNISRQAQEVPKDDEE